MTALSLNNEKSAGFIISFVLHVLLFAAGGAMLTHPVEYAVVEGSGGIEVSLTAAPSEAVSAVLALKSDFTDEAPLPPQEAKIVPPALGTAADTPEKGDGSSPVPGKDKTTFYSSGGAETEVAPNYLKNPAPEYPAAARRNGWSGVVVLKVMVDKAGRVVSVEKESGSGYDILDQSALKTVRSWRFRPARVGSLAVESSVRVPIRFQLDKS